MTAYYTYKNRTLRQRQTNRRYRQLVAFLCGIITLLTVLLLTAQANTASADEMVIETYQSTQIRPGDCLWDLAEEYCLPDMPIEEYIDKIYEINHLKSSELITGEYLILPVYTYQTAAQN